MLSGRLADLSIWASFQRMCLVIAAASSMRRLQLQLDQLAVDLGWRPEFPTQVDSPWGSPRNFTIVASHNGDIATAGLLQPI